MPSSRVARTGLGQGMAFGLAEAGADIVGIDLNNLAETRRSVEERGGKFLGIEADLSNIKGDREHHKSNGSRHLKKSIF